MPAEILGEKKSTAIKTTESILVCTQEVGTGQLQQRKEREENTALLALPNNGQILQNSLLTIFTITQAQNKFVSEILSSCLVLFTMLV